MGEWVKAGAVFGSILYALIGVVIFWLSFVVIDKLTPYDLWGEIVEKHNVALGIVVGAMSLVISNIVETAIPR
jgi:putative membrane protein